MDTQDTLLALSVGFALALQNVFARQIASYNRDIPSTLYVRYFMMFALVLVIFFAAAKDKNPSTIFKQMNKREWVYTILIAVATIWALGQTYNLLTRHASYQVVPYISIYPVWIVLVSLLFFKEKITLQTLLGIGVIVGGLYILASEKKKV